MIAPSPLWRRWAALLDELPEHHATALGTWLPKLALAVGPLRGEPVHGEGEPDGISGLSSRGSYERLLVSEWAVAEVAPDEFVRRAAMGEHLFLRRATRVPEKTTCTQVWIDAGPEQLGSPRLAHIALLIVLAERAEAAGVAFRWGVLQEGDVYEGLVPEHLVALMRMRTVDRAADLGLRDFVTQSEVDDLWWIGGPEVREALGLVGQVVEIEDVLEPEVSALDLRFGERTLRLELPSRQVVVSLLRNPLAKVADVPKTTGELSLGCAPSGAILLAQLAGKVRAFSISKQVGRSLKRRDSVTLPSGHVVATGWARRRIVVLMAREGQLHLEGLQTPRWDAPRVLNRPHDFVLPSQGKRLNPLFALPRSSGADRVRDGFLCVDGAGQLWTLIFSHGVARRVTGSVVAMAEVQHSFVLLTRDEVGFSVQALSHGTGGGADGRDVLDDQMLSPPRRLRDDVQHAELCAAHTTNDWGGAGELSWLEDGRLLWSRGRGDGVLELELPLQPGWSFLGVQPEFSSAVTPKSWVVLSPDRSELRHEPAGRHVSVALVGGEGAFMVSGAGCQIVMWSGTLVHLYDPLGRGLVGSLDLARL